MRQLPPRRRDPDLDREPIHNALNPGPPASTLEDNSNSPWLDHRRLRPKHQDSQQFDKNVYFDREQVPLRHGGLHFIRLDNAKTSSGTPGL